MQLLHSMAEVSLNKVEEQIQPKHEMLAYEGSEGLGFSSFKTFCKKNQKHFISKKANRPGADVCTWGEICEAMELHAIVGDPLIKLVESPVTFFQLVNDAYDRGIFTEPVGLEKLKRLIREKSPT